MMKKGYATRCNTPSDINEHLPTLWKYAKECNTIVEAGVRSIVSSYAFAQGLVDRKNQLKPASLIMIDLDIPPAINEFQKNAEQDNIKVTFLHDSDLKVDTIPTDLLFIDTWHIYGQLKRELKYWHKHVGKYIIMHDTTVDEWLGENVRGGLNNEHSMKQSGYSYYEITMGLWPAIAEFLTKHSDEWELKERYTNNNGLTVLQRIDTTTFPVVYTSLNADYLWNNKYSSCSTKGAIVSFIKNLHTGPLEIFLPLTDGVCDLQPFNKYRTELENQLPKKSKSILGVLASRKPYTNVSNKIVHLPLDDETFEYGLEYVLLKEVGFDIYNLSWNKKQSKVYWRGVAWPFRQPYIIALNENEYSNVLSVHTPWNHYPMDSKYVDERNQSTDGRPVPLKEHFEFKYILIMDGVMIASNLQWVFGSGSVPILITNETNEYWFKNLLIDNLNCVMVSNPNELLEKIKWLVDHDDIAENIANQARLLANSIFTPQYQQSYLIKEFESF